MAFYVYLNIHITIWEEKNKTREDSKKNLSSRLLRQYPLAIKYGITNCFNSLVWGWVWWMVNGFVFGVLCLIHWAYHSNKWRKSHEAILNAPQLNNPTVLAFSAALKAYLGAGYTYVCIVELRITFAFWLWPSHCIRSKLTWHWLTHTLWCYSAS